MLLGLTGNFGTGKSTVLKMFEKFGAITIDSDEVVSRLYNRNDIQRNILSLFGEDVLSDNGEIDKLKIADIIFNNIEFRNKLEALLHPLVFSEIETLHARHPDKVVVAEIPLLFESAHDLNVDAVILTVCKTSTIYERLTGKGINTDEIKRRLDIQITDEGRRKKARYVINTDNDLGRVEEDVRMIYNEVTGTKKKK